MLLNHEPQIIVTKTQGAVWKLRTRNQSVKEGVKVFEVYHGETLGV
jgi:hypothetical protein